VGLHTSATNDSSSSDDSAVVNLDARNTRFQALYTQQSEWQEHTASTEQVRCNVEYLDRLANLCRAETPAYATADSGADTNVLGHQMLVVSTDPLRRINLVGLDAAHAMKKGLSIVTADTIAQTADGTEVILRAHQSVLTYHLTLRGSDAPCRAYCGFRPQTTS
jgi:hypothetical protein